MVFPKYPSTSGKGGKETHKIKRMFSSKENSRFSSKVSDTGMQLQCLIFILKWKAKLEFFLKESSNKKTSYHLAQKNHPMKKERILSSSCPEKWSCPDSGATLQHCWYRKPTSNHLICSLSASQPTTMQKINKRNYLKFQQIWQTNIVFVSWVTWMANLVPGSTMLKRISFFRIYKLLNNLIYIFVNGSLICVFRFEAMKSLFSIGFFIPISISRQTQFSFFAMADLVSRVFNLLLSDS